MTRRKTAWILSTLWVFVVPAVAAAPSDDLKLLLDQGKAQEAYELGKRIVRQTGDILFDRYFGVAAIDTGNVSEGVRLLEEYLKAKPDDLVARLELARGYFLLNDNARARTEFEAVKNHVPPPPPEVIANIDTFLEQIRGREAALKTAVTGYLEGGIGYDSNVNGGVGDRNIFLANLGNVTVDGAGVKTADSFTRWAGGAQVNYPRSPSMALFAAANFDARLHRNDTDFDQLTSGLSAGLTYVRERNLYRASLFTNRLEVNNVRYRNIAGLNGEWQHQLTPARSMFLSGQWAHFDYSGDNSVRDADFSAFGLGLRQAWNTMWQPALTISVNSGREKNIRLRDDLSKNSTGMRLGLDLTPKQNWTVGAGLTYQEIWHFQPDALLLTKRNDDYAALDVAVTHSVSRNLSVRGELLFSETRSNIALYRNKRDIATVNVRYDFR